MQKNPGENITSIEVDPVTGDYVVRCPSGSSQSMVGMRAQN